MLPDPALLVDPDPSGPIRADGRPQPALREELRRIPSLRNAWSVAWLWIETPAAA